MAHEKDTTWSRHGGLLLQGEQAPRWLLDSGRTLCDAKYVTAKTLRPAVEVN
jgi:hypothetical protein